MTSVSSAVELSRDCPACGLEAGVVEVYDSLVAACRFGVPARTTCKLCRHAHEAAFDREVTRSLREIPVNRCPACESVLAPSAVDEQRCGACGGRAVLVEVSPALALTTLDDFNDALDAWADRTDFATRAELVAATFCEPAIDVLFARLQARAPLEILADPFANLGVRTSGGQAMADRPSIGSAGQPMADRPSVGSAGLRAADQAKRPLDAASTPNPRSPSIASNATARGEGPGASPGSAGDATAPVPADPPLTTPPPPSAPPRAILYPLVSVIVADGEIHPGERRLLDRFLESEGLAPLSDSEFRVHHPSETAHLVPKERREGVIQLMCETASIDGMPDESERRVIQAYAAAWGVDDEKVDFWFWGYENMNTSLSRQLWLKLRRFVLSARWENRDD